MGIKSRKISWGAGPPARPLVADDGFSDYMSGIGTMTSQWYDPTRMLPLTGAAGDSRAASPLLAQYAGYPGVVVQNRGPSPAAANPAWLETYGEPSSRDIYPARSLPPSGPFAPSTQLLHYSEAAPAQRFGSPAGWPRGPRLMRRGGTADRAAAEPPVQAPAPVPYPYPVQAAAPVQAAPPASSFHEPNDLTEEVHQTPPKRRLVRRSVFEGSDDDDEEDYDDDFSRSHRRRLLPALIEVRIPNWAVVIGVGLFVLLLIFAVKGVIDTLSS